MLSKIVMQSVLILMLVAACGNSSAGDIDAALRKAKAENKIVMLELGSVGCIPCESMKPVMARLRESYNGKLDVIFIDVKKDHDAGRRFGVYMIPTQVFLDKTGREFHRHVGFYSYEEIAAMLKETGI